MFKILKEERKKEKTTLHRVTGGCLVQHPAKSHYVVKLQHYLYLYRIYCVITLGFISNFHY